MQINLKQPGQPVADFSIAGAVVTIAGLAIDCELRQQDSSVSIEVRASSSGAVEGGDGAYLGQINIPARMYIEVPGEDAEEDQMLSEAVALDPNAVSVTLWPTV